MMIMYRMAATALAIAIALLSLQPSGVSMAISHADKLHHLIAYGVLCGFVGRGWPRLRPLQLVVIVTLFGGCIELAQGLIGANRVPSWLDALANMLGAAIAAGVLGWIRNRRAS